MKNIAIIGLGGIAQKAYLPYMRQLKGIHWHLFTRNQRVLEQVASLFGTATIYNSLEVLVETKIDGVFIHTATVAHLEIARLFLQKGIPVYMDKPLTESYEETKVLYDLAKSQDTFLMAGFNRRFAPKVGTMAELADKRRIVVEKNDVNRPGDRQFKIFDFFIHPLDTALYLADDRPKRGYFTYKKEGELLSQVSVTMETATSTIVASMNLQSGSRRELMEVQTPAATLTLKNLEALTIYEGTRETKDGFESWDTTLYKRGFELIIDSFLRAIETGINPVSPESSLLSHWICDQINKSESSYGQLCFKEFYQ